VGQRREEGEGEEGVGVGVDRCELVPRPPPTCPTRLKPRSGHFSFFAFRNWLSFVL
jgi:hypothetical protein